MSKAARILPSNWTAGQDEVLRRLWPTMTATAAIVAEVNARGPQRSGSALRVRASALGIERAPVRGKYHAWTIEQDAVVRRDWPAGLDAAEIALAVNKLGPARTPQAVKVRAIALKIRRGPGAPRARAQGSGRISTWSAEQDAIMRSLWPTHATVQAIVETVNQVPDAVLHNEAAAYARATKLKLRRPPSALQTWRRRGHKVAPPDPLADYLQAKCRTEIRDGVAVTVCPPGYARGAWRQDSLTAGPTARSRRASA